MARPTTISDEQILAAAREVFLERGIAATTAEVARKAGVAEGSIFKRWKTKHELFFAALTPDDEEPEFVRDLGAKVGAGDVCETLTEIGLLGIQFFRKIMPLAMMCWSNPAASGLPAQLTGPSPKPIRVLKKLAAYFAAEMQAGRLARRDAEVVARTFLGSIQHFAFLEIIDRNPDELPMPAEMFVRGLVHLIWNCIDPARTTGPKESPR